MKDQHGWRIVAYARTRLTPVSDSVASSIPHGIGRSGARPGDPSELIRADSLFSAMSVAQGAKPAFLAYATEDAISFGGARE